LIYDGVAVAASSLANVVESGWRVGCRDDGEKNATVGHAGNNDVAAVERCAVGKSQPERAGAEVGKRHTDSVHAAWGNVDRGPRGKCVWGNETLPVIENA